VQRADRYNKIGPPKSESGERTVPLPPLVLNTLRSWREECPKGHLDLVFPNKQGGILRRDYIVDWGLKPVQVRAGVVDENREAKYTGMHSLRHFFASWCLNRKSKGGRELPPKVVQVWLGHSTIAMTLDTYAHCFTDEGNDEELAAAELKLASAT
jgi:integrase